MLLITFNFCSHLEYMKDTQLIEKILNTHKTHVDIYIIKHISSFVGDSKHCNICDNIIELEDVNHCVCCKNKYYNKLVGDTYNVYQYCEKYDSNIICDKYKSYCESCSNHCACCDKLFCMNHLISISENNNNYACEMCYNSIPLLRELRNRTHMRENINKLIRILI